MQDCWISLVKRCSKLAIELRWTLFTKNSKKVLAIAAIQFLTVSTCFFLYNMNCSWHEIILPTLRKFGFSPNSKFCLFEYLFDYKKMCSFQLYHKRSHFFYNFHHVFFIISFLQTYRVYSLLYNDRLPPPQHSLRPNVSVLPALYTTF